MNLKKNIFNAITIILLAALIAGAVLLNNRIKKARDTDVIHLRQHIGDTFRCADHAG